MFLDSWFFSKFEKKIHFIMNITNFMIYNGHVEHNFNFFLLFATTHAAQQVEGEPRLGSIFLIPTALPKQESLLLLVLEDGALRRKKT